MKGLQPAAYLCIFTRMKNTLLTLALSASVLAPALAFACDGEGHAAAGPAIKKMTVTELQSLKNARAVDANSAQTRASKGVIPNAVLLTSASQYEPAKELPAAKDAALVFYCANTMCTASEMAAERAVKAGYTNVAVLPVGIDGWRAAGQKTQTVKPQS